jgi:hypothetical protein
MTAAKEKLIGISGLALWLSFWVAAYFRQGVADLWAKAFGPEPWPLDLTAALLPIAGFILSAVATVRGSRWWAASAFLAAATACIYVFFGNV